MAIRAVDLNLFRVFESLLMHRSVVGAARDLSVTPSAISHALARLRRSLGDELFVAGAAGMEPTAFALNIASDIRAGMTHLSGVLERQAFVPQRMTRTFTIGASEYTATKIVAPLICALGTEAPLATVRVVPGGRLDIMRSLDEGRMDLMLGWFGDMATRYRRREVSKEEEALLVRAGHPLANMDCLSTQAILRHPFLVVELTGTEDKALAGFTEERQSLRRTWIERLLLDTEQREGGAVSRVAATVPYYGSVAPILQGTDMVATLPRSVATSVAERYGLVVLKLPYVPLKVSVEAVWHQRSDNDREVQWLIERAATLAF